MESLVNSWISNLQAGKIQSLDQSIARAICYWPVYKTIIHRLEQDNSLQQTVVAELMKIEFGKELNWHHVLLVLLLAAVDDKQYEDIHGKLCGIYKDVDPDAESAPHFYYLFASTFQDWIIYHSHKTNHSNRCKHKMCSSCKASASVTGDDPSLAMLDIFYQNHNKTYTTFKTILGISSDDNVFYKTTLFSHGTSADIIKAKNQLFDEFKKLIIDIKNLVYVNSRMAEIEEIVENGIKKKQAPEFWNSKLIEKEDSSAAQRKKDVNIWDKYIANLKVIQLSCFVRSGDSNSGKTKYNEVSQDKNVINGALPTFHYLPGKDDGKWRYKPGELSIFYSIIGELYKEGFPNDFFKRMENRSSTDVKKARGMIFVPDGEITFFHLLYVVYRLIQGKSASFKGKDDLVNIDWKEVARKKDNDYFDSKGEIAWNCNGWWKEHGDIGVLVKDIFSDSHDEMASKCSSLIAYVHMIIGRKADLTNHFGDTSGTFFSVIEEVKKAFCEFSNPNEINPSKWLENIITSLQAQFKTNEDNLEKLISSSRVQFLPEIILRKGDCRSHTLFFLPFETEENKLPMTMIAGTVRGVEDNYLPFSTHRSFAHVYPLSQIFSPIIIKLSEKAWEESHKEELESKAREEKNNEVKTLFEFIEKPLQGLIESVQAAQSKADSIKLAISDPMEQLYHLSSMKNITRVFEKDASADNIKGIHSVNDLDKDENENWVSEALDYICKVISPEPTTVSVGLLKIMKKKMSKAQQCESCPKKQICPPALQIIKEKYDVNDKKKYFNLLKILLNRSQGRVGEIYVSQLLALCITGLRESGLLEHTKITIKKNGEDSSLDMDSPIKTVLEYINEDTSMGDCFKFENVGPYPMGVIAHIVAKIVIDEFPYYGADAPEEVVITEIKIDVDDRTIYLLGNNHLKHTEWIYQRSESWNMHGLRGKLNILERTLGVPITFYGKAERDHFEKWKSKLGIFQWNESGGDTSGDKFCLKIMFV